MNPAKFFRIAMNYYVFDLFETAWDNISTAQNRINYITDCKGTPE